ncbi:hypothetical protein HGP17_10295 [Rhizobium sp. P38BS-XIX]|uniref:hypothetical protein n=1 Tax=Rhizobium sp. P38BS-XIX TaxID=2726740 RepID=UPI0014565374|nr:hypothetical protein [Rhizobium sp. P38BS-XIX]NLR97224.1 hypothetical protein [Rhizobium sp. P38BS-XIX]
MAFEKNPDKSDAASVPATELGLPNPIQPNAQEAPRLGSVDTEREAYERGVEDGKRARMQENPFPDGSSQAKAYEHGYLDGQKTEMRQD